jgi:hypothetical protein
MLWILSCSGVSPYIKAKIHTYRTSVLRVFFLDFSQPVSSICKGFGCQAFFIVFDLFLARVETGSNLVSIDTKLFIGASLPLHGSTQILLIFSLVCPFHLDLLILETTEPVVDLSGYLQLILLQHTQKFLLNLVLGRSGTSLLKLLDLLFLNYLERRRARTVVVLTVGWTERKLSQVILTFSVLRMSILLLKDVAVLLVKVVSVLLVWGRLGGMGRDVGRCN